MIHVRRLLVESRSRLKYQAIKLARIHNWKSDWIENVLYVCTERWDRSQEGEKSSSRNKNEMDPNELRESENIGLLRFDRWKLNEGQL